MSAGALRSHLLGIIVPLDLSPELREETVAVLDALDDSFLQFVYDAGADARLPRAAHFGRAASCALYFAAVQLADDLADGECGYLARPFLSGPMLVALLQTVSHATIRASRIPGADVITALGYFSAVANAEHAELRTRRWTLGAAKAAAAGLNGMQFTAYCTLLWAATPLARLSSRAGFHFGIAVHIASDVLSDDRRYASLQRGERKSLVSHGIASVNILEATGIPCIRSRCPALRKVLARAG